MPEVIIKYKTEKALQALKDFSKYFDFKISSAETNDVTEKINGVSIILGNRSVDTSSLKKIFTGKNVSARDLRSSSWKRK
jgi:hypothetical protein